MRTHELKTWPTPFAAVKEGTKRHEIRANDRDYAEGDTVVLREWDPTPFNYTATGYTSAAPLRFTVGTVTPGGQWGLPPGLCVFTLLPSVVCVPVETLRDVTADAPTASSECPVCGLDRPHSIESLIAEREEFQRESFGWSSLDDRWLDVKAMTERINAHVDRSVADAKLAAAALTKETR